jgi:acetyl esterase/lipase
MSRSLASTGSSCFMDVYLKVRATARYVVFESCWRVLLFVGSLYLKAINLLLDTFGIWFHRKYFMPGKASWAGGVHATDGAIPPNCGIDETYAAYGNKPYETVEILHPRTGQHLTPVLYVHGGGWIAANSTVLLHSVAPLARAGFPVYSINYPLAPKQRFPDPLVAVIRSLSWLKTARKIEKVIVIGDSAGGNLATMSVAMICNKPLLKELSDEVGENIVSWEFPVIVGVSSLYGILDQYSWCSRLESISAFESSIMSLCLAFAHRLYRSESNSMNNHFTLLDVIDKVKELPPVQLLCGDKDPLVLSNRNAQKTLANRGFTSLLIEYDGRHAFVGFPPKWIGTHAWMTSSRVAMRDMIDFARSCCATCSG